MTMLRPLHYSIALCRDSDELDAIQFGWTALIWASRRGHTAAVQAQLADARVQVNLQDGVSQLAVP